MPTIMNIPCYPCDKELLPSSGWPQDLDEKRESTTFFNDFKIAEAFGVASVKDTAKRAFKEWKSNIKYITELAAVANHLGWYWYGEGNTEWSKVYFDLFEKCNGEVYKADDNGNNISAFTDEEVCFYHNVLD